ncbi:hypothetical protein [Corynebacterium pyruviciproducens]|uniref:hypothetical protein n=1 Tax=Corynebacterium pyruviciproducens TaxID=598660 RepID=UPI0023F0982B|nr:hypothetical protein [Corynebacterium pyruviciproducens]
MDEEQQPHAVDNALEKLAGRDVELTETAKEVAGKARAAHPSPDPPVSSMKQSVSSPVFLTGLVKWHPAIGSFQFLADCTNPADMPADQRFNNAIERWKCLFYICLFVDFIVMATILAGLGIIAFKVIQATLFS